MHKLEISGTTPEDLFMNAVRMLSVLLKGGVQTAAAPDESGKSAPVPPAPSGAERSEPLPEEQTTVLPPKAKAKRGSKTAEPAILNDDISDVGKTIEHKALTLDGDIRPRLRAIQKAHAERGNDMPACVAYIQKLYGPFGIAKADQLNPESFAEFMDASAAYLSGEA